MKVTFEKNEYQSAKEFLKDAILCPDSNGIHTVSTSTFVRKRWIKPDKSLWVECESLLEYPYDDYSLKRKD